MLKERLEEALMNKRNDLTAYVWKGKKVKVGDKFVQEEIKLVDATPKQLKEFYDYCELMLNNPSKEEPGRYTVLQMVQEQRERCNVELFLRSLETEKISRYSLNVNIQELISDINKDAMNEAKAKDLKVTPITAKDLTLADVSSECPTEFRNIPLTLIIDGCLDKLGVFNRKHLTLAFILKQGVWLTPQEITDLTVKDEEGNIKNRLDVIRERLNIDKNIIFRINSKGLSYTHLRAMLQLKNKKYSEMTTDQLKVLRNRILFNLENEVKYHIRQWETRMNQIEEVAKSRNIKL